MSDEDQNLYQYADPENDPTLLETKVGTFGGPNDKEDNGQFYFGGGSTMADGTINPENYAALPKHLFDIGLVHPGQQFDVTNPRTGASITVVARDTGPSTKTGRGLDLAPHAAKQLGLNTDETAVFDLKQFIANKAVTPHPTQGGDAYQPLNNPMVQDTGPNNPQVQDVADKGNAGAGTIYDPTPTPTPTPPEQPATEYQAAISAVPPRALIAGEPTAASIENATPDSTDLSGIEPPPEASGPEQALQPDEVQQPAAQAPQEDNFVLPAVGANVTATQVPGTNTYKLSNGYTYDKDSQTVTYPDPSGNGSWSMQRGQKPIFHAKAGATQTPEDIANTTAARKGLLRSQFDAGPEGDQQFATARLALLSSADKPLHDSIIKMFTDRGMVPVNPETGKDITSPVEAAKVLAQADKDAGRLTPRQQHVVDKVVPLAVSSRSLYAKQWVKMEPNLQSVIDSSNKPLDQRNGVDDAFLINAAAGLENPDRASNIEDFRTLMKSQGLRGKAEVLWERVHGILGGSDAYDRGTRLLSDAQVGQIKAAALRAAKPRYDQYVVGNAPHLKRLAQEGIPDPETYIPDLPFPDANAAAPPATVQPKVLSTSYNSKLGYNVDLWSDGTYHKTPEMAP